MVRLHPYINKTDAELHDEADHIQKEIRALMDANKALFNEYRTLWSEFYKVEGELDRRDQLREGDYDDD